MVSIKGNSGPVPSYSKDESGSGCGRSFELRGIADGSVEGIFI